MARWIVSYFVYYLYLYSYIQVLKMNLFDVYPLFDIEIAKGIGCRTYDKQGIEYLDLYGGHAVISIGHSHPYYVQKLTHQLENLVFYSNSVVNKLQVELADKLGKASGYEDYSLFLANSGAEANENALKLASFHNGRRKVIAFNKSFHGRTSAAVRVTNNPKIVAPINEGFDVEFYGKITMFVPLLLKEFRALAEYESQQLIFFRL